MGNGKRGFRHWAGQFGVNYMKLYRGAQAAGFKTAEGITRAECEEILAAIDPDHYGPDAVKDDEKEVVAIAPTVCTELVPEPLTDDDNDGALWLPDCQEITVTIIQAKTGRQRRQSRQTHNVNQKAIAALLDAGTQQGIEDREYVESVMEGLTQGVLNRRIQAFANATPVEVDEQQPEPLAPDVYPASE